MGNAWEYIEAESLNYATGDLEATKHAGGPARGGIGYLRASRDKFARLPFFILPNF